jgi:hypothetical protein
MEHRRASTISVAHYNEVFVDCHGRAESVCGGQSGHRQTLLQNPGAALSMECIGSKGRRSDNSDIVVQRY